MAGRCDSISDPKKRENCKRWVGGLKNVKSLADLRTHTSKHMSDPSVSGIFRRPTMKKAGGKIIRSKASKKIMAKKNTDTVPAMLTPGEFVIKKKSAKKIGYDKLNKMNKTGKIVSKNKKSKGKKMAKTKKKYQFGGVVKPPIKADPSDIAFELAGPGTEGDLLGGRRGRGGIGSLDGGMMGYKKGGKVKATGGYKVVGQRKGYKVGE